MGIFQSHWSRESVIDEYLEDRPIFAPGNSDDFISTLDQMVEEHSESGSDLKEITVEKVKERLSEDS
jgi:hypothetical protein